MFVLEELKLLDSDLICAEPYLKLLDCTYVTAQFQTIRIAFYINNLTAILWHPYGKGGSYNGFFLLLLLGDEGMRRRVIVWGERMG